MLVLNRRQNQRATITIPPCDHEQVVEVVLVNSPYRGFARIGFVAERHIQIVRDDAIVTEPNGQQSLKRVELLGKGAQS